MLNLGRVRHSGDDSLGRFDRIVAMSFDLWKFVEYNLRQFALLKIEDPIVPKQKPPARFLVGLLVVEVFRAVLRVFDLPEDNDRAFLASANVSAQFVRLAHRQPERRNVLRCGKQKMIDAAIRLPAHKVARQSR